MAMMARCFVVALVAFASLLLASKAGTLDDDRPSALLRRASPAVLVLLADDVAEPLLPALLLQTVPPSASEAGAQPLSPSSLCEDDAADDDADVEAEAAADRDAGGGGSCCCCCGCRCQSGGMGMFMMLLLRSSVWPVPG